MSIAKKPTKDIVSQFAKSENDTGSVEVQCAIMTSRILSLNDHFISNPKDYQARRGLLALVNQRRKLLNYLKKKDLARYQDIIQKLELRK